MKTINAVIVEDSRLARNELRELIKLHPDLNLLAEADNVDSGYEVIIRHRPELLFLDINLPEKSGFELLEMLDEVPITIFTTAFDEYAIKSFEYNTLDYLLKPINEKRFAAALNKVRKHLDNRIGETPAIARKQLSELSQIFIKDGEKCWLVRIADVYLFEIVGNYTRVYFKGVKPLLYRSLNQVEEKLPPECFFRANRQQIININYIDSVTPWFNGKLKLGMQTGEEVEVSRRQSYLFKERLSL